jgi:hypothetical protein
MHVPELHPLEKCGKALMDFARATDIEKCLPKRADEVKEYEPTASP